ncbi:PREDICTED: uncharacterized protein LOC108557085 [Nicrophorus vespilloides]|uniref:Uncharacterized protein LOC108557085 n=1 Tax=Nicrophorus vespilloides TaxID=110193 RepID=A0ABM1M307_NICVS|nr:PREDICTED: uncharacterized protein LOC108557085 [Nicrophorus vespilloides]
MTGWKTEIKLYHSNGCLGTGQISIKRGIFQGDSLSPMLFCMSLISLTSMLNLEKLGYSLADSQTINHLLYMDDLKLYARDKKQLDQEIGIVKKISDDISMEFGLDKCSRVLIKKGKLESSPIANFDSEVRELDQDEVYKYLSVDECDGIRHREMKKKLRKDTVLELLTGWALSFSRWTRKLLTIHGCHHPKADVDRLYMPTSSGGRGPIELESAYYCTIVGLSDYICESKDRYTCSVKRHEESKAKVRSQANEIKIKYFEPESVSLQNSKGRLKSAIFQERLERVHGQFLRCLQNSWTDKETNFAWLRSAGLKGETESLIVAAHDQALNTRYHQKKKIGHIIAGCTVLAPTEFTHRHNKIASYLHWSIVKELGQHVPEHWYDHQPAPVVERDDVVVMREKRCTLIDVAVPADANIAIKVEKLCKYKDLEIEIARMWNTKTNVVPVVVGALWPLKIGFEKYLEDLPFRVSAEEVQKIALLGTAHILRKVLSIGQ